MATAEHQKAHRKRQRDWAISLLGRCCVSCGSEESLELDHIDPKTKSFDIGTWLSLSKSRLEPEVRKCQLLCKTCHREKTNKELRNARIQHGTLSRYKDKCRCRACQAAWRAYLDKLNHQRKENRRKASASGGAVPSSV